jgi:hypothetical protein
MQEGARSDLQPAFEWRMEYSFRACKTELQE